MTTGFKIAIGVTSALVVAGGAYLIYRSTQDWKEKGVLESEQERFGSLGELMEMARRKHPSLGAWYDALPLNSTALIEEGWERMSQEQKDALAKGLKKTPMSPNIEEFFKKKGYRP